MILVGKIRGCFGVRGYLKLELTGRPPEKAKELRRVFIGRDEENAGEGTVESVRINRDKVVIKLESVDDRTTAQRYTGTLLFVSEEDAVAPPPGSWFIHDLLGCEVRTVEGVIIGSLSDVQDLGGQHIWKVEKGDAVVHIPAVKEFITRVDIKARVIVVRLPEGLLEI